MIRNANFTTQFQETAEMLKRRQIIKAASQMPNPDATLVCVSHKFHQYRIVYPLVYYIGRLF